MLLTHRRLRLVGVLIALALPSFLSLSMTSGPSAVIGLAAAPANAGTYNVSYCGNDGVAQNWATYATAPGTSGIACGPGGRMFANLPQQSWGQGSNASLSFTAPDNTTIAGWHPTLRFSAAKTTENTERMVFTAGIPSDPNPPVKCVNLGCPPVITEVPIRAGAKTVNALTRCADERPDYNLCDFTADVTDTGGTITLQDDSAPTARTSVSGSLTTAGAPRTAATGTASVHTLVDDTGSGIASVELQVDGKTAGVGPACAAQPTTKVVPCPLTQDATVNVDTTLIADGRHSVKLVATDASGNATTIWDSTIFVANTPIGPGSPDDLRGAPTAPTATDDARITATWPSTARHPSKRCKSKSFRKSHRSACKSKPASSLYKGNYATKAGATVTGRVTNKTTKGVVAGAPVLLIATPTRGGAEPIRLSATANDNGRYSFKLPRNSGSRNVVITTTARANDVRPAAATNARLLVRSTMRLKVDRKAIRAGRAVHFTASLRDQTPGVPAVLEVYAGGKWRVFQADATKAKGRFRAAYKFGKTGRGTYKFRARARPTSSTPWAYLGAPSSIVKVRVR